MNIETLREYVLGKPSVTEGFPFGDTVIVYKTHPTGVRQAGKVFLLLPLDTQPLQFNVKCHPEKAIELREAYPGAVLPGYHMNKKHWNTIVVDGTLSNKQLLEIIDESYRLVNEKRKK